MHIINFQRQKKYFYKIAFMTAIHYFYRWMYFIYIIVHTLYYKCKIFINVLLISIIQLHCLSKCSIIFDWIHTINLLFKNRFGKRKSTLPISSAISKPRQQQYVDQHIYNNLFNREDDEAYKSQFKPTTIRNSKDLYDLLFSSRHDNGNNNHHQFYLMQQDANNADIGLD